MMEKKAIYELRRIIVPTEGIERDYLHGAIDAYENRFGMFSSEEKMLEFVRNEIREPDFSSFYMVYVWIMDPDTKECALQCYYEYMLDCEGNKVCVNDTKNFALADKSETVFKGRDDDRIGPNDKAWFYDDYAEKLLRCTVGCPPFTKKECESTNYQLESYDDSYLVYPDEYNPEDRDETVPLIHSHILSCYMLTDEFVRNLIGLTEK